MSNGPSLVIRGTILGSLILALLGWFLAGQIKLSPTAEVAYAADPSQAPEQMPSADNCQVSSSYPRGILQWCNIITAHATQAQLPPNLIAAVILMESGGGGRGFLNRGARGVVQGKARRGDAARCHFRRF